MGGKISFWGCASVLFLIVEMPVQSKVFNQTQIVPKPVMVSCVSITGAQETPKIQAWVVDAQPFHPYPLCKADSSGMTFTCHMKSTSVGIVIGADKGNAKSNNCANFYAPLYIRSDDFPKQPQQFKWPCYCSFVSLKDIGAKFNILCSVGNFSQGVYTVYINKKPHQSPVQCPPLQK